jgi:hypothetical protein
MRAFIWQARGAKRATRHLGVLLALLIASCPAAIGAEGDDPVVVKTGVYISGINDFDIREGSYEFTGYLWFRWRERLPAGTNNRIDFVLVNGEMLAIDDVTVREHDGWYRQSHRFTAELRNAFPLHKYPFDRQELAMVIEHRWLGTDHVVFQPDEQALPSTALAEAALGPDVQVRDWSIIEDEVAHTSRVQEYSTNFGWLNPNQWDRQSSRYALQIPMDRSLMPYIIKSVVPLTIIVLMSFCVFYIDATEFQAQISITITALLSAIAFHISQANTLPKVGYLVVADIFYLLSYLVIFLALVQVIVTHVIHHRGHRHRAERIDDYSRIAFPVIFFLPIGYLIAYGYQ